MKSVTLAEPLDRFEPLTIPVSVWLAKGDVQDHEKYIRACHEYLGSPHADNSLRVEPHVAYDALYDKEYFIFKQENNGTCILVGETLPRIPPEDLM